MTFEPTKSTTKSTVLTTAPVKFALFSVSVFVDASKVTDSSFSPKIWEALASVT
jgi:hypothetical protein